jgi:predicted DNA-binding protein (UPF0251 family)
MYHLFLCLCTYSFCEYAQKYINVTIQQLTMRKMRYRRGWRGRGRPPKPVSLGQVPTATTFTPNVVKNSSLVTLFASELEAMRLVDQQDLDQKDAGKKMGVSRGTVWRLLQSGRKKVVMALTENRPLIISIENPKADNTS